MVVDLQARLRRFSPALRPGELVTVLLVAALARTAAVLVSNLRGLALPVGEPWAIARNLAAGNGFAFDWYGLYAEPVRTSFLPPLYPWILSLLLQATGGRELAAMHLAQGLNVLLGAGTCLLVARLAAGSAPRPEPGSEGPGRFAALRRPPLAAGLAWAVYPPALGHAAQAHTPVLEAFLLSLLACLMLPAFFRPPRSPWWAAGGGIVLGLLMLVRPSYGLVWAGWSLLLLWQSRGAMRAWRTVLVMALLATATLMPWTVRNYRLHDAVVPVATNGGFNFYLGNNPQMGGDIPSLDRFFSSFPPEGPEYWRALSEVERDREFYRQGIDYWRDEPGGAARGAFYRLLAYAFFRPYLFVAYPPWLALLFLASYAVLLVPFLLALRRSRGPVTRLSLAAIVITGVVGMAYVVSMRFRASVEPFYAVVAAGILRRQDRGKQPADADR